MSENMSGIPAAGKIDLPIPPDIRPIELIQQVIENISGQIALLDVELCIAQQDDTGAVSN